MTGLMSYVDMNALSDADLLDSACQDIAIRAAVLVRRIKKSNDRIVLLELVADITVEEVREVLREKISHGAG